MPYLDPPQNGAKPSSRFTTLKVFKLKPGSPNNSLNAAPPPPPKDPAYAASLNPPPSAFYNKSFFSRSATSLVPSLSPESAGPVTPSTPYPPIPSAGLEFGKRSNIALASVNGRAAAGSPAPSASGGSLWSLGRGGVDLTNPSMDGSDSSGSCPNANANLDMYLLNSASSSSYTMGQPTSAAGTKPKKTVFNLASLAKRNKSKKDLSDAASVSGSISRSVSEHDSTPGKPEGDEGISLPWNFQHNIHVDEGYIGLPPSWSSALSQVGFDEDEIAAIHARRRAAVTGTVTNTNQANPHSTRTNEAPASPYPSTAPPITSTSSSTILLAPVPRSTSLRKGRDALTVYPPSLYSVATSTGGSTIGPPSPAPSPRAPSFSMKSFVSGIKNSLTTDSASMKEGVDGSRRSEGAAGEESEQYVFVDGDGPDEGADEGTDKSIIEPYPYDTSSVSSHHTNSPRIRQMSQGQQTPRTPAFPQIQVQRTYSDAGQVMFHSSASRTPSPLVYSTSLPVSTPPRGHTHSNLSASPSPSPSLASTGLRPGPASAPPRTPPRRIYHVVNASSDSYDGTNYTEPPPAYVSPKKGTSLPKKEKEGFEVSANPPPSRPIPPIPTEESVGEPSGVSSHDSREEGQGVSMLDTTSSSVNDIPGTADEVLDISSYYGDNAANEEDAEAISPTAPLAIDKRMTKLAMLPPRISFHQEGSLEDWSESLFSVIGGKEKRSSILMGGGVASVKKKRRSTLRPVSPLSITGGDASVTALISTSEPGAQAPTPPDMSFRANFTPEPHARGTIDAVEEGDEQEETKDDAPEDDAAEQAVDVDTTATTEEEVKEVDESPATPLTPILPDASLGANVSPVEKDVDPLASTPPLPSDSPRRTSVESLPPSPPPKPKPKPAPLTMPPPVTLTPPRMSIITGISGRSPVNSLFGAKPQPLPIPIPPSQIRAQLRPAPPKPPHPPPTLPLPPLKRLTSQLNLPPPPPAQTQLPLPPVPSPQKAVKHDSTASHAPPSDSRPNSFQTLHPVRVNPDRDSDLSTITVTPATIATAKAEVVRTAVASVIDSDAVSLASRRESVVSTADTERQAVAYDELDMSADSLRTQEREDAPGDSLICETSSVSLLRDDGPQSKWPRPPPPPVELDSTPRRVSRFRTTSLGRVSQLQAMSGAATSPCGSHSSHSSSDTTSSTTSESAPLTTPKGVNVVPTAVAKPKVTLAAEARLLSSTTDTFGGVDVECENSDEAEACGHPHSLETPASLAPSVHPLLAQLKPYISPRDPTSCFTHLVEIAEGESGSVFAARVVSPPASNEEQEQRNSTERPIPPGTSHVAIKRIPLPPVASSPALSDDAPIANKLVSVLHELVVLKGLEHDHLLLPDAIYAGSSSSSVDENQNENGLASTVDTSLWIRMELMERSLADVIGLVDEGLALQERLIARFASDILHGLDYLQKQHIAHRDVRSDNLLVNASGVVKLADFSNAIRVDRNAPIVSGAVGVIYWQAPEMRAGPYDALKVDVWSLGATVWELAETMPPFSTPASPSTQVTFALQQTARHLGSQWPPLTHPEHYSRPFHEFLRLCGRESAGRPCPGELLNTSFIRNACGRAVILQLLSQCRAIEEAIAVREASSGSS